MSTTPRIVGLSGFMRTGKDSVAILLERFGYQRVNFADPLRKMAADIDPFISLKGAPQYIQDHFTDGMFLKELGGVYYTQLLNLFGYEACKEIPDFRRFLQRLGTEGVRNNFGMDAWVERAIKTINDLPMGSRVVMSDVRFLNEAQAVKDQGGVIWRLVRPGFGGGTHASEALVEQIVPDVILEADNLIDLGVLVLREIEGESFGEILPDWAESLTTS